MKFQNTLKNFQLIFIVLLALVSISGCISDVDISNIPLDPSNIDLSSNESLLNSSLSPSEISHINQSISDKPSHYEKLGICYNVVDGDTLDVKGVGRIRLIGVNTPERGEPGYIEAKNFVKSQCLGKTVYLDIDDKKNYDRYGRILAVVYVGNTNINAELLRRGYAEIMYIPPSEFPPGLSTT